MTDEPGAEEGGEDIFKMPEHCVVWECNKAPLINKGIYRVCSNCGASYGNAVEEVMVNDELREKAKRIRRGESIPISTVHGGEYAQMLIEERIPFRADYPQEFLTSFYVIPDDGEKAYKLLMKLRGSKL